MDDNSNELFFRLIRVTEAGNGVVGQPCQFRVDASQAGEGQLEISINDGEVPNHVQVSGLLLIARALVLGHLTVPLSNVAKTRWFACIGCKSFRGYQEMRDSPLTVKQFHFF